MELTHCSVAVRKERGGQVGRKSSYRVVGDWMPFVETEKSGQRADLGLAGC